MAKRKKPRIGGEMKKANKQEKTFQIKKFPGRAMLHWRAKRPLSTVRYYEAQLREKYGQPGEDGWLNRLYWGDNLQVISHLMKDFRGKIKLIYIDPPFDSKADYRKRIKIKGKQIESDIGVLEEKQYTDIWANDDYLQFMYERLQLMRELLADDGSIYLHCDYRKDSHLRLIMDEIFGEQNFRNEIIWHYRTGNIAEKIFARRHDVILMYSKSQNPIFNPIEIKEYYSQIYGPGFKSSFKGRKAGKDKFGEYRIIFVDDVWDISAVFTLGLEHLPFQTQKPEALLKRIIKVSSNEGDLVADFFCGTGTAMAVAQKLDRRWIGGDINLGAIHTTAKRLSQIIKKQAEKEKEIYPAFTIYNVNYYDIFKNALEAKEIAMKLYGVAEIRRSFFDGRLDGKWVKIIDLNRVCSKLDIQSVFDEVLGKGKKEIETTYRDGVLVLCSGHEFDVEEYAKKLNLVNIPFELRDILTDRKDIIFKRPPEAEIDFRKKKNKGIIKIQQFYSPILLQKLQLEDNPERIEDWRQIVETVLIDERYNGKVFQPSVQDIPGRKDMVKGEYEVELKGKKQKIAIKIVDVLDEEYFKILKVS